MPKKFPFFSFDPAGTKRPLIPCDFPVTKNVMCLVDSGASFSLMTQSFLMQQKTIIAPKSRPDKCEGICGDRCLEIKGQSKPIAVKIHGIAKTVDLEFSVIPDKARVREPILGQNLFEHFKVGFGKENGKFFTYVKD